MFGKLFGKKKQAITLTEEQEEERRLIQEEEELRKQIEKIDKLLPWHIEQKVACCLNPIKVFVVGAVAILGTIVEYKMGVITENVWEGPYFPSCYIHKLDSSKWAASNYVDAAEAVVNSTVYPLTQFLNQTITSSSLCEHDGEQINCEFLNSEKYGLNFTVKPNYCGLTVVGHRAKDDPDRCELKRNRQDKSQHEKLDNSAHPFLNHLPYIGPCIVWAIYKITFLPVHPIDRIALAIAGHPVPGPEPIFKLLTEPNFQTCHGVMGAFVTIFKIFRYSLLPNALLVPLLSIARHPDCSDWIYYDIDTWFGKTIYYWCIFDFTVSVTCYALVKTVLGGSLVGTWKYRLYKSYWFMTTVWPFWLFWADFISLFNWKFWEGFALSLKVIMTFNLEVDFTVDFVQWLGTMNLVLDSLTFTIMVLSLLLPKGLKALEGHPGSIELKDSEPKSLPGLGALLGRGQPRTVAASGP